MDSDILTLAWQLLLLSQCGYSMLHSPQLFIGHMCLTDSMIFTKHFL